MRLRTIFETVLVGLLAVQLSGCGTLFYPERRGTEQGKLDADIVLLDAVGLFFFIIPGVIAFAVDIATGTIYLPTGEKSRVGDLLGSARGLVHPDGRFDPGAIEAVAVETLGAEVEFIPNRTWVLRAPAGTNISLMLDRLMESPSMKEFGVTPERGWQRLEEVARASRSAAAS